ncbi:MAG: hypothetical protein V4618_15630 [Pseudomonadota bacterium]
MDEKQDAITAHITVVGGAFTGESKQPADMLDIPPSASRVICRFVEHGVTIVIAPLSPQMAADAGRLEAAGGGVAIDQIRRWVLPVLGPIFGRHGGAYRLARQDETVVHIDWTDPGSALHPTDLQTFVKEQILGLIWTGNDWVSRPGTPDPFVDLFGLNNAQQEASRDG